MRLFGWFRRKKVEEKELIDSFAMSQLSQLSQLSQFNSVTTFSQAPKHVPLPFGHEDDEKVSPYGYVTEPEDFKWFKCSFCRRKVLASDGEHKFTIPSSDYYTPPKKVCMSCVSDIAFAMGVTPEELKKAEKRRVLECLKGKKDE